MAFVCLHYYIAVPPLLLGIPIKAATFDPVSLFSFPFYLQFFFQTIHIDGILPPLSSVAMGLFLTVV